MIRRLKDWLWVVRLWVSQARTRRRMRRHERAHQIVNRNVSMMYDNGWPKEYIEEYRLRRLRLAGIDIGAPY